MSISSDFSLTGLPIGDESLNMTYLYGISDFFEVMFKDTSRLNLFLEATAESASDIYSRFLQLTSSLSLENVQSTVGSQIKLVLLKTSQAVQGEINTYRMDDDTANILSAKYIANRPLLPTTLIENNVDFYISEQSNGERWIRFSKDVTQAGYSTRLLSDGVTREYALWFVDVEIDEQLIAKFYGNLLKLTPQTSSDTFRNFVYGLFYTYMHGPALGHLRKGLNLTLGIPLARDDETILDIRPYLDTDQFIVVGEKNSYIIPYGLPPIVEVGQEVSVGDEIAQWVELKDYINDGDWWVNLYIPPNLIPSIPEGQKDRYATKGSVYDSLMRQYLKKHTFLVNVKVESFRNIESFSEIGRIVREAKPSYTQPIYIWSLLLEDVLTLEESEFKVSLGVESCDPILYSMDRMNRGYMENSPIRRGCPIFLRWSTPNWVTKMHGNDTFLNGHLDQFNAGPMDGFSNPASQFRENTPEEKAWLNNISSRGSQQWRGKRSHLGFRRNIDPLEDASGQPRFTDYQVPDGSRIIPMFVTLEKDIEDKLVASGLTVPAEPWWHLNVFKDTPNELISKYSFWEGRSEGINYLISLMPRRAYQVWTRPVDEVLPDDYLLLVKIYEGVVGVYWVTQNQSINLPIYDAVADPDPVQITWTRGLGRGMNYLTNPFYFYRGRSYNIPVGGPEFVETRSSGAIDVKPTGSGSISGAGPFRRPFRGDSPEINGHEINRAFPPPTVPDVFYSDQYNPDVIKITREIQPINHAMELGINNTTDLQP